MEQLTKAQRATGELRESIIVNFKKYPSSRNSIHYYEERIRRLDYDVLRSSRPQIFHQNYYQKIEELVTKYRGVFESDINETLKTPTLGT